MAPALEHLKAPLCQSRPLPPEAIEANSSVASAGPTAGENGELPETFSVLTSAPMPKTWRLALPGSSEDFALTFPETPFGILGTVNKNGVVELVVEAGKGAPVSGTRMFDRMMTHFGSKAKAVRGKWVYGDNLGKVNELTTGGKVSLEDTLRETWTGKRAAEYGFTNPKLEKVEGTPGAYTNIEVLFEEKPQ